LTAARLGEKDKAHIVRELLDKALVQAMQLHIPAKQVREIFEDRLSEHDECTRTEKNR
jgi:hypothetical protein